MEELKITDLVSIPADELEAKFARSSGPGGQNVNKVNSKVTLRWQLQANVVLAPSVKNRLVALAGNRLNQDGSIQVTSQEHRDQPGNLRSCMEKLRQLILAAMRPMKTRRATAPTRASQRRRLQDKRALGTKKQNRRGGDWD